jgi:GNAT superfamily N-acetyltransferase
VFAFFLKDPPTLEEIMGDPGPRIHEVTLRDFLGRAYTPEQIRQQPHYDCETRRRDDEQLTASSIDGIRDAHAVFLAGNTEHVELRHVRDDCRIVLLDNPRKILALSPDMETVYGGTGLMLAVLPEYRGRGIGAAIHLAIDGYQHRLTAAASYTEAGYACRLAAHREAVIRAHEEDLDDIHPENLERYADLLHGAPAFGRM